MKGRSWVAGIVVAMLCWTISGIAAAQEEKKAVDEQIVRGLVTKLASTDAAERDKATEDLAAQGVETLPLLKEILKTTTDAESKWRLEHAIKVIEDKNKTKTADNSDPNIDKPAIPPADADELMKKAAEIRNLATAGGMANPQELMAKAKELADLAMRGNGNFMPGDVQKQLEDAKNRMQGMAPNMPKGFDKKGFDKSFKRKIGLGGTFEDLPAEEVTKLALAAGEGAVRVKTVMAGQIGERAGLKIGDIVTQFNGQKLPAEKPLAALRKMIDGVKAPCETPIVVIREGKPVELKAKWEE